jgi:uncharacterized membrane protein YidH (DUF202 family)
MTSIYGRAIIFAIGISMMLGAMWMFYRLGKVDDNGFFKTLGTGVSKVFAFFLLLVSIIVTASAFY